MGYITTSGILYIYMQCILCIHAAPCKRCIRLHEEKCGKARKKKQQKSAALNYWKKRHDLRHQQHTEWTNERTKKRQQQWDGKTSNACGSIRCGDIVFYCSPCAWCIAGAHIHMHAQHMHCTAKANSCGLHSGILTPMRIHARVCVCVYCRAMFTYITRIEVWQELIYLLRILCWFLGNTNTAMNATTNTKHTHFYAFRIQIYMRYAICNAMQCTFECHNKRIRWSAIYCGCTAYIPYDGWWVHITKHTSYYMCALDYYVMPRDAIRPSGNVIYYTWYMYLYIIYERWPYAIGYTQRTVCVCVL